MTPAKDTLDHLLIGSRTLEAGIEWLDQKTEVLATVGGSHPGLGTWNALASLGNDQYIEIIAPDPTQPGIPTFYVPRLRDFVGPRVATWAARGVDLKDLATRLPPEMACAPPREGSRVRPDGVALSWTLAFPKHREHGNFGGALPFLIEWGTLDHHPSRTTPKGLSLNSMRIQHPEADSLRSALRALGVVGTVDPGPASVTVEVETPRGVVRL